MSLSENSTFILKTLKMETDGRTIEGKFFRIVLRSFHGNTTRSLLELTLG